MSRMEGDDFAMHSNGKQGEFHCCATMGRLLCQLRTGPQAALATVKESHPPSVSSEVFVRLRYFCWNPFLPRCLPILPSCMHSGRKTSFYQSMTLGPPASCLKP